MENIISRNLSVHQEHELLSKLEAAGLDSILAQNVIISKSNALAKEVVAFLQKRMIIFELTKSQKSAQAIMGGNFFGVEEAMLHFGVNPTPEQLATLAEVPFSPEVLNECKDSYILKAYFSKSIFEIWKKFGNLFCQNIGSIEEKFIREYSNTRWWLIRKTAVEESFSKDWEEQIKLISDSEEVPPAEVVVDTAVGFFNVTGERIFENEYVRTSTISDGHHVIVGCFVSGGLFLNDWDDGYRDGYIGLASSRKFRPLKS